ncbi:MAG TPA: hypothetical protein PLP17_13190, partial [Oligoflexia bacterium]|nr:hypothetical protein [Oligoflexia bacterium]
MFREIHILVVFVFAFLLLPLWALSAPFCAAGFEFVRDKHGEGCRKYIDGGAQVVKDGPWKHYYADGKVSAEGGYNRGKRTGAWVERYPSGTVKEQTEYKNGIKQG